MSVYSYALNLKQSLLKIIIINKIYYMILITKPKKINADKYFSYQDI